MTATRDRARLRRRGGWLLAGLLAAGCAWSPPPRDPAVIVVAARAAPNSLHPLLANDEGTSRVADLVFEPLLKLGDDLRPVPALALRLEHPDPLTYVAYLRTGVRFHDGHELTAADVVYTYGRMLDPDVVSPFKGAYRTLASVRALGTHAVAFTLKEPFAAFPMQLTLPIVPDGAGDELRRAPVGTGPYRFVRYVTDDRVELAAFEQYWGGAPQNAGVVLKIVPDDTMRGLELRNGSADLVINDLPADLVYQLERSGDLTVTRAPGLDFSYIGFNLQDPVVSDVRVRHAVGYAIDRDAIVRYLRRGLARKAFGLVPPQSWAFEPDVHQFTHDPDRARRLLDEAGYPDPDGSGPLPRLGLTLSLSTNEETRLQATVIQENLREVGIALTLRSHEFATFFEDVVRGNFQMATLTWIGGAMAHPDILRRVFHSSQTPPAGFNRGRYRNREVDRLLDLASAAATDEERRMYYGAVQRIVAEDAPYIPIWNRTNVVVAHPSIAGLRVNTIGDYTGIKDAVRVATP